MNGSYIGSGETLQITAQAELAPGQVVAVEDRIGVVQGMNVIPAGEVAELALEGVFALPISTSGTYAFGANLSLDSGSEMLTPTGTSGSAVVGRYWDVSDTADSGVGRVYLSPLL